MYLFSKTLTLMILGPVTCTRVLTDLLQHKLCHASHMLYRDYHDRIWCASHDNDHRIDDPDQWVFWEKGVA